MIGYSTSHVHDKMCFFYENHSRTSTRLQNAEKSISITNFITKCVSNGLFIEDKMHPCKIARSFYSFIANQMLIYEISGTEERKFALRLN